MWYSRLVSKQHFLHHNLIINFQQCYGGQMWSTVRIHLSPGEILHHPHTRKAPSDQIFSSSSPAELIPQWKNGMHKAWLQTKIAPTDSPKEIGQFSSPRCAMKDSYCHLLIRELGWCQEGKYEEEEERRWKGASETKIIYLSEGR